MADMEQMVDILRVEGIMAQGYGINPKIVMRDKRLSPTAKAIYGYIASFAGGGNQAFPSREIMIDELQITKDTYYKHMKFLVAADYIRIERTKGKNGTFDRNLYTIVSRPNPVEVPVETASEGYQKKSAKVQSAGKEQPAEKRTKNQKVKRAASVKELRERLQIDWLKETDSEKNELIEEVFMAVKDMEASEQISISGTIKKKEAIQELLNQLTAEHIRLVTNIMANNKKRLINRKSYIQACIANSIFDIRNKNEEAAQVIKQKEQEEIEEKKRQEQADKERQELTAMYEQSPELEKLDTAITEIVKQKGKAVLSKNEVLIKSLDKRYHELEKQREILLWENPLNLKV